MSLPVIDEPNAITPDTLQTAYRLTFSQDPPIEQVMAWKSSLEFLKRAGIRTPVIAEMPILGGERADFIFVDDDKGLVVEMKGWRHVRVLDDYVVEADGKIRINPCYQVENYVNKLNYFHSSGIKFQGVVVTYNAKPNLECKTITDPAELSSLVDSLGPFKRDVLYRVVNGKFYISDALVELLQKESSRLLDQASKTLLSRGYGLTGEQAHLVHQVIEDLENGVSRTYLVRGESGSGKTLVALTLLFEGLKRKKSTVLAYKNNRLLNTLKKVLNPVSGHILFYSTGHKTGVGEPNFKDELDLVIFDEAQRMTKEVIRTSMNRGTVRVYFYDENQILMDEEEGTREAFLQFANPSQLVEGYLASVFRQSREYISWVKKLLWHSPERATNLNLEVRVFDSILDMLSELSKKEDRALICAFTESEGDEDNPHGLKNVRIGYPLQSGFELYKGVDLRSVVGKESITWLMDPKKEYPVYWTQRKDLSRCASVYGAQGFEAEYVGVVWGRDLVWSGKWEVNPNPITDNVGRKGGRGLSLKKIAKKDRERALALLRNRYYVMLTRGIRGVYVFAEDRDTGEFLRSLVGT